VVLVTTRSQVAELGRTVVGHRVDVVVFEAPPAAAVQTFPPREGRDRTEVECGLEGSGNVPAEVFHRVDVDPIVENDFQEGILGQLFGDLDGDGTAIDDVAGLAGVGVAATPGVDVADDNQISGGGPLESVP
jgi:hypothetical protein